jgi:hypothetical protein
MAFRDDLIGNILAALKPAVSAAVDQTLGIRVQRAPAPSSVKVDGTPVKQPKKGKEGRPAAKAKGKSESYSAGDPNARRLPNFVRDLVGGELKKTELLAKYGYLTFTPRTTNEELEAAAAAWAASKENPSAADSLQGPKKESARKVAAKTLGPVSRKKLEKAAA